MAREENEGETVMRRISLISAGILLLFLGAVAPASANQDQRDQGSQTRKQEQTKPEVQQPAKPEEQKQAKPEAQQQKPQTQARPARQEQRQQRKTQPEQAKSNSKQQEQQAQPAKEEQQKQSKSQQARAEQNDQQKERQANNQQERTSQQRQQSAYSRPPQRTEEEQTRQRAQPSLRLSAMVNSRIPDARFHSNFGRTHEFRIGSPRMVDGYSRFQYGGYWFGFVQPWPTNWYYSDDVYVDYINGQYYLCNPYYPGVNLAISVVM